MSFSTADYRRYLEAQTSLLGYCIKLTGSLEAGEDLLQTALLKGWEHRRRFQSGTNLKGWLSVIARNEFFSQSRRKKRVSYTDEIELRSDLAGQITQPDIFDRLELQDVFTHINAMAADKREALLRIAAGETYDEAAQEMGVNVGTIKSRVSRARAFLEAAADKGGVNGVKLLQPDLKALPAPEANLPTAVISPAPPSYYVTADETAQLLGQEPARIHALFSNFSRQLEEKGYVTMGKPRALVYIDEECPDLPERRMLGRMHVDYVGSRLDAFLR